MSGSIKIAALALLGLLGAMTAGCVPKSEYDKAVAASRRAHEELQKAQEALLGLRQDLEAARAELAKAQADADALRKINQALQAQNADLTKRLDDMKALYDAALAKIKPGEFKLPYALNEKLKKLAEKYPGLFDWREDLGMLKMKADLTFDKGSTTIKPEALAALKELAKIMNDPDAQEFSMYIAGHTDALPLVKQETIQQHGSNWGLAAHRSLAVIKALAEDNIDQARMGALGFSKYHPIEPNAADGSNEANRRVEIWIVPPERLFTTDKLAKAGSKATIEPKAAAPKTE